MIYRINKQFTTNCEHDVKPYLTLTTDHSVWMTSRHLGFKISQIMIIIEVGLHEGSSYFISTHSYEVLVVKYFLLFSKIMLDLWPEGFFPN